MDVYLGSASNKYLKRTFFFDQSIRLPLSFIEDFKHRGDTSYVRKDTLDKDLTSVFVIFLQRVLHKEVLARPRNAYHGGGCR